MNPNQPQQDSEAPLQTLDLDNLENLFGGRQTLPSLSDIRTATLNALRTTNTNLREENNRLATYVAELDNKNHDLTVKVLELETANLRLEFQTQILKQLLDDLQEKFEAREKKLQDFEELQKKLQDLEAREKKLQDLEEREKKLQDFEELQKRIQDLEAREKKNQDFEEFQKKIENFAKFHKRFEKFEEFQQTIDKENNDLKEPTPQTKSNLTKFKLSNRDVEKPLKDDFGKYLIVIN
ncbi:unnamed protein product [Rotaria sp. Silwood2]|nr:unnamed protein product [Rotaria sp. Silwood2]